MIVLGVALAVVALLVIIFVGVGGGETVTVSALGVDVTASSFVVFLAGAATLLVLLIGLWMIRWGVTRYSRTRAEMQRLRRIEAEVEARQIASLSGDSSSSPTHHTPTPTHYAPPTPETRPSRDDGDRRDDPPVSETRPVRPFEKDSAPSGATAAEADRTELVPVSDADRDGDGSRDNSRL